MNSFTLSLPAYLVTLMLFSSANWAEENMLPKTVDITTTHGTISVELFRKEAPITTDNFLEYVRDGFYNGTIFHRVIPDFMIQGGGFTAGMNRKETRSPIQNEASNRIRNQRGTVAMARTREPHSATAQFFINHDDNDFLNHKSPTPAGWGYAVFGKVTNGIEVVDRIARSSTGSSNGMSDVPSEPILILNISETNL